MEDKDLLIDFDHVKILAYEDLSDEQKKTLQDNLNYVEQLATRLDKTGDANDKEGTQANWDKLKKILTQLRTLYQTSQSN